MRLSRDNKFTKTSSQFYLDPIYRRPLVKVRESEFLHKTRYFRDKKVHQISESFTARKDRSLVNYHRLSQVLEAQEKVFRSSSSFANPQKASLNESSKRLNSLLKAHILSREFQERKKAKLVGTQKQQQQPYQSFVSNYRYFDDVGNGLSIMNEMTRKGSFRFSQHRNI